MRASIPVIISMKLMTRAEPVYRVAEKEWKDFIDEFTPLLMEADTQIPPLPPNDVVHRIYRDVRFCNLLRNRLLVDRLTYRCDSAMTRHRTRQASLPASRGVVVRVYLPDVRLCSQFCFVRRTDCEFCWCRSCVRGVVLLSSCAC